MLNAKAFSNAVTLVTAVFYIACWALSTLAPDLIFNIAKSWIHSLNIDSLKSTTTMSWDSVILGLVTISVLVWVTTYTTIWLYNLWAKKPNFRD